MELEDLDRMVPLIDLGTLEPSRVRRNKERRSFYDVPRTLSEEDDTFGILNNNCEGKSSTTVNNTEGSVNTGLLVEIDSSQSSNDSTGFVTRSMLQSSKIDPGLPPTSNSVSSSRGMSVSSLNSNSRCFGDISHISSMTEQTSGRSFISNDSVFDSRVAEQDPNWEMIMNEAKILASTINKDQTTKFKLKSTDSRVICNFSPSGDGLDSPLVDLEKEFSKPDEFLVPLTPDRSPVKDLRAEITLDNEKQSSDDVDSNEKCSGRQSDLQSSPLLALPEHEIDGVPPAHHQHAATPKNSQRQIGRSSASKGKVVKPRQILGSPPTSSSQGGQLSSLDQSVEKQVKSKVQQSNVRRTRMTNPSLISQQTTPATSGQPVDKTKPFGGQKSRQSISSRPPSAAGTPAIKKAVTPLSNKVDFKNIKSRINTGMPSVKNSLTKAAPTNAKLQIASTKKPDLATSSARKMVPLAGKVGGGSVTSSSCKKPPTPLTGQRGALQRQGSNIVLPPRPSTTTPLRSRQSLSFATPSAVGTTRQAAGKANVNKVCVDSTKPFGSKYGSKPATPSRLLGPGVRTPSMRSGVQGQATGLGRSGGQSVISSRPGEPKSRSSLRFSALPSPNVCNKENNSLVCSTPAVNSARPGNSSGLPSPIRSKRRAM